MERINMAAVPTACTSRDLFEILGANENVHDLSLIEATQADYMVMWCVDDAGAHAIRKSLHSLLAENRFSVKSINVYTNMSVYIIECYGIECEVVINTYLCKPSGSKR